MKKFLWFLLIISLAFNVFLYDHSKEFEDRYFETHSKFMWSLKESKLRLDMFLYYRSLFANLFLERMYDKNEITMNELRILKKLNWEEIEKYKNMMWDNLFNKSLYLPVKALIFNNWWISAFKETYNLNSYSYKNNFEDITDEELNESNLWFLLWEESCYYIHEVWRFIFWRFSFHNTNIEDRKCTNKEK